MTSTPRCYCWPGPGSWPGGDKRFRQTIEAIRAELSAGPLLYRLSGSRSFEGALVACRFWLVDALVRSGQSGEARKLWRELTGYASDGFSPRR